LSDFGHPISRSEESGNQVTQTYIEAFVGCGLTGIGVICLRDEFHKIRKFLNQDINQSVGEAVTEMYNLPINILEGLTGPKRQNRLV
jgi:hypothetical protein